MDQNAFITGMRPSSAYACMVLAVRLLGLALMAAMTYPSASVAGGIWRFVDRDGVVHIGNGMPTTSEAVTWQNRSQLASLLEVSKRGSAVLKLPGFNAARAHLELAANTHFLEPAFVFSVAAAESAFNTEAVSKKGALGLMQIMPATAERYGVTAKSTTDGKHPVMDPSLNAHVGSRYLADLLKLFDGDKELALAAYNAGEGAVIRHGRRIPPYSETQLYVEKVMRLFRSFGQ